MVPQPRRRPAPRKGSASPGAGFGITGVAFAVAAVWIVISLSTGTVPGLLGASPAVPRAATHYGPGGPGPGGTPVGTTSGGGSGGSSSNSTGGGGNASGNQSGGSGGSGGNRSGNGTGNAGGNGTGNQSGNGTGGRFPPGIRGSLQVGAVVANFTPSFFQVVIQTPNLTSPWLWPLVNATPFTYYYFGGSVEVTDQLTGVAYADNGSALPPTRSNDSNFVAFCRTIHCHAIMSVPAEINNTSMVVATVLYVEQTLGFHPDYWQIGNEPQGWTHYDIPWANWSLADTANVTPLQYARDVQTDVAAMRAVDPGIRIIGIGSADGGAWFDSDWLDTVAAVDGRNLSALAIHPYPGGLGPANPTLAGFYSGLSNTTKFPYNYQGLRAHLDAACGCALPLWVGEYNAALNGTYAPYLETYPEVPYLAAGIAGALKQGIPALSFFAFEHEPQSLVAADGAPYPIYALFATFLKNLTVGAVENASVAGGPAGVYAVVTENGSRTSVLVVNTNTTAGLNLSLPEPLLLLHTGWSLWSWGPNAGRPLVTSGASPISGLVFVPAEGVVQLNLD